MIPAEQLTEAGFAFDDDMQEWSQEDGSSTFTRGDRVDFRVDRIHESIGTLSIEGSKPVRSPFQNIKPEKKEKKKKEEDKPEEDWAAV